jgi:transcriptional regulator with GAF, ATPase, and Fis domain
VILSSGNVFSVDESWLPKESSQESNVFGSDRDKERKIIEAALRESRGRVSGRLGAAAKLKIPPRTLENRIKSLKISKSQFRFG